MKNSKSFYRGKLGFCFLLSILSTFWAMNAQEPIKKIDTATISNNFFARASHSFVPDPQNKKSLDLSSTDLDPNDPTNYVVVADRMNVYNGSDVTAGGLVKNGTSPGNFLNVRGGKIDIADFVKGSPLNIDPRASIGSIIDEATVVDLPEFKRNAASNRLVPNLFLNTGGIVTVNNNVFNVISISEGTTVRFTQEKIYANSIRITEGSNIEFDICTEIYVNKEFGIEDSSFNTEEKGVTMYVQDGIFILGESNFTGFAYSKDNQIVIAGTDLIDKVVAKGKFYGKRVRVAFAEVSLKNIESCGFIPLDPNDPNNYTLIAEERIYVGLRSVVETGGVVINGDEEGDYIKVREDAGIVDFAKGSEISVGSGSLVGEVIEEAITIDFPEFIPNTLSNNDSPDLIVDSGETVEVDESVFGDITLTNGSTVIFTQPQISANNFVASSNSSVQFTGCAEVLVKNEMRLTDTKYNLENHKISIFANRRIVISSRSNVSGIFYSRNGFVRISGSFISRPQARGQFYGDDIFLSYADVCLYNYETCPDPFYQNDIILSQNIDEDLGEKIPSTDTGVLEGSISLYPNPSNDRFMLTLLEKSLLINSMQIIDRFGRILKSMDNISTTHFQVDVSHLVAGTYFVKIRTSGGVVVKQLLKN